MKKESAELAVQQFKKFVGQTASSRLSDEEKGKIIGISYFEVNNALNFEHRFTPYFILESVSGEIEIISLSLFNRLYIFQ